MSGHDHQWYPAFIIPFGIHISNYITTAICMRTSAAQNLQKNILLHTHLDKHYGSSSFFKSLWKRTAYIDENAALLKCGRRYLEQQTHSEFAKL